ncbi:MAG TPA: AAA family ATPase, partial [Fimbriimonas sp.]|nr:AAA family ATPase [Fimbriimonas sp.]
MINSLRVRCFKAIADSNELPLGPLTCLIGRTGSGKSSLIDALDWLSHACAEGLAGATQHFTNHSDLIRHGSLTFELELKYDPGDVSIGDEVVYKVGVGARPDGQPFVLSESLTQRRGGDISERIRTESGRRERRVPVASNITRSTVTEFREGKSSELEPLQRYVDESAWSAYDDDSRLALTLMDPTFERGGTSLVEFLERSVFLRLNPKAMASFGAMYVPSSERLLDDEGRNLAFLLSQLPEDALADLLEK